MAGKDKGKKPHMAIIIAVKPPGGKAPKKPEDTANAVGVKKGRPCKNCSKGVGTCLCKGGYC